MIFFTKYLGKKSTYSGLLIFSVFLIFIIGPSTPDVFSQSSPDFGLKRTEEIIKLEQNDASSNQQITVSSRNGFDSLVDLNISIAPQTKLIQITINGETSLKVDPKNGSTNLNVDIVTGDRVPPGDYKVTVAGTSTINGQKITRVQSFIIKIVPPKEFSMEVKPPEITIPQGGSGSVNIKTTLKKLLSDTFRLYATFPANSGLSVSISGDGEFVHFLNGYDSDWTLPPDTGKSFNTKFQIKASPKTPPGKYIVSAVGRMDDDKTYNDLYYFKAYTLPIYVTVTKEPKFSQLQLPTQFDLTPEFHRMTINPGNIGFNDIQIWSERPDEPIEFDVSVIPAGQGVAAGMNKKMIVPNNLPALGSFVTIVVSGDAKPGTYKIVITGTTSALSGKELEQITEFEVIVPKKEKLLLPETMFANLSEKTKQDLKDSGVLFIPEIMQKNATKKTEKKPDAQSDKKISLIISDIEELTRETSELLDKQMEKREQQKKEQKSKSTSEDKQVLTGLFTAAKWLEYANKMVSDALKEDKSQESKDGLKQTANQAKEIKQLNTDIKKEAKESKVSQVDLNKAAKEPIDKLKSKKQTKSEDKIKEAQQANEKVTIPLSESAKWLGEILDSDRVEEEELKKLPGLADTLTVKTKDGYFEGDVCEGRALVMADWEIVNPKGYPPGERFEIGIDIFDDGKKIPTKGGIWADNFEGSNVRTYQKSGWTKFDFKTSVEKRENPNHFYIKYEAIFDPKKGKTIEFKLGDDQPDLPEKYALIESQFPLTVKIPACKIDSVIDDLPVRSLTDQDLPIHDKKSDITSKPKDESKSDTTKKPIKKADKPKDTKKKDITTKPKTSTVEYDSQTITGLFGAIKWAQYSQTLLLDAVNQHNKGLKTQIKEDEAEYAETKNRELMEAVVEYKDTVKENEKTAKDLVKIGDQLKKAESEIRKEASKKRILPADLNEAAQEPLNKIEIIPPEELDKLKEAEKAQKETEEFLKLLQNLPKLEGPIPILKLSVKDLEWSYNGEICDGRVTIMLDWQLVDQNGKSQSESSMYVRVFEGQNQVDWVYAKKSKDGFELDYKVSFDPKKGKTLTFQLFESILSDTPIGSITAKIPACPIDSVIDDLQPIVVIDQDGAPRKDTPRLVSDIIKINDNLKKITKDLKDNIGKSSKTQDKSSQPTTAPQTPTSQPPSSQPPTSQIPPPTIKTIKLVDKNRSAVQHSADPCLTTHTIWYQFAFTNGGYPAGDKITVTESGPRGNLVHKGTLDAQGKYQIIIQNPPMQPGFEFRLTEYSSSGNKLETSLPDTWQFNVGPCVMPGTPGMPQPPSQPPAEQQSGNMVQSYFVQVFIINGKDYPIYQFVSSAPDSCNDYHFHTSSGKAYAIDGTILNDPAQSGCGYGKTNSMGFASAYASKSQITAWESLTGINIPEDD